MTGVQTCALPICFPVTIISFSDWFSCQPTSAVGQLANFNFIDLPAFDTYMHMIKRQPKSRLDTSIQSEYPALQTIVYHPKVVNAVFGPVFKYLTTKFLSMVDSSKFFFYTRKKPEDLQEFFSDLSSHSDYEILELDVSDRKSTRLNSSHRSLSRMPSSA